MDEVQNAIMQRWIVLGVVAMALLVGGGALAYHQYKRNLPAPVWVPLPVNPQLPEARRDETARELRAKLCEGDLLLKVARDVGLAKKWNLPTDEEAAREIERRLFVRSGDADTAAGKVPAIHVGMNGANKDREVSGEITTRLMDDVWRIIGIKRPPK